MRDGESRTGHGMTKTSITAGSTNKEEAGGDLPLDRYCDGCRRLIDCTSSEWLYVISTLTSSLAYDAGVIFATSQ